ncbi:MAG: MaoC family dehydratase [Paludibacterium sp.]|uniref:MaoC family dehydratase n=1 Tax=Paludibacterium sp. TaxID=1917523 RepID=UPI0025D69F26|nr:MaoC family dehydratase [Paludibacterium sp.]MBV8049258.1 MaoC family dehydratase [Paludibacterium sp.]MBV8648272.1 MaoC family dehydratase [Paludibacterium sp.]
MTTAAPRYLQDFALGQTFASAQYEMTIEAIKAFAAQFDPQPFHLDEAAARDTLFAGLAASGWHTASVTMRLLVGSGLAVAGGLVGAGAELRWPRPTRPGDVLQVFSEVLEIKVSPHRPERGLVALKSETRNQHGDVVQVMTSRLSVPARGH